MVGRASLVVLLASAAGRRSEPPRKARVPVSGLQDWQLRGGQVSQRGGVLRRDISQRRTIQFIEI